MQNSSLHRKTGFLRKRILVVERSRTIQTLLSIYFRNAGHQVITCTTPQEALRTLAGLRDVPDSIFLAVHAQEQDDYTVIQYVHERAAYAHTMLVVLLVQEDEQQVQQRVSNKHVHYLIKPFRIQDALALVAALIPGNVGPSETQRERGGTHEY